MKPINDEADAAREFYGPTVKYQHFGKCPECDGKGWVKRLLFNTRTGESGFTQGTCYRCEGMGDVA